MMTNYYSKSTGGFYPVSMQATYEARGSWPADAVEIMEADRTALSDGQTQGKRIIANAGGLPVLADPLPPTVEQVQSTFTAEIQERLDNFARTRGYDSILSACTYSTSTVPKFASEGQAAVNLRDATWAAGYAILAAVEAGTRAMPTLEAVMDELPSLVWPA